MLAVVNPGTLTMTRWTSPRSVRPASAMARRVASATFRIWPIRPTSSGGIASEPARPTTSLLSCLSFWPAWAPPSGISIHCRVTAAMCGVITPGHPPERTKMTCLATSLTGIWRKPAVHSRSATSAHTRPQSSCDPLPSVFPTRATRVSGVIFPESASCCNPDESDGVAVGQTNSSTRCAFIARTSRVSSAASQIRAAFENRSRASLPAPPRNRAADIPRRTVPRAARQLASPRGGPLESRQPARVRS